MKICKQLLGVHKTTTNLGVLLETGRVPWHIHAIKASIKNWERIRKSQANPLLIDSYTNAIEEQLPWIVQIRNTLETNDMLEHYLNLFEVGGDVNHKSYPIPCSKYVYAYRKQGSTIIFGILVGLTPCTWGLKIGTSPNVIKI